MTQREGGGGGRGAGGGCTGECVTRDGWEDSEPSQRFSKSAEKAEAARRAGSPRVGTGVGSRDRVLEIQCLTMTFPTEFLFLKNEEK